MRKGLTYMLSTCLMLGLPTITQAQELGDSKESVEPLITNEMIAYPLNRLDSEKVDTQGSYNLNLVSDLPAEDAPFTSTIGNNAITSKAQAESTPNQVSVEKEELAGESQSSEGQADESGLYKANVTGELEKEITGNSTGNNGELSVKPSKEVLQKENEGALNTNELSAKKDIKKADPVLSLSIVGLNITILGENKHSNSLLSRSLLSVELNSSLSLKKQADEQLAQHPNNDLHLLGIGLGLPVLGNVSANVLGQTKANSKEEQSTHRTLLGVDITGSKLVGDAHVGVLEGGKILRDNEEKRHGGLAVVELHNIFWKTHLGVAEFDKVEAPDYEKAHAGLVIVDVNNTPLGDGHLGLAEVKKVETPNYSEFHSGLIIGDVMNTPLGNAHLGLIEYQQTETDEYKSSNGGLVVVDIKDSPINDSHIGIGEFQQVEKKDPVPTQEKPKEEQKQEEQLGTKPVEGNPENGGGNESTKPGNLDQPSSPVRPSNPNQPSNPDQSSDSGNPGQLPPSTPANGGNQEQPGKVILPGTENDVDEKPADIHENAKVNEIILANDQEKNDPIAKFIEELIDTGNKMILNQPNTDNLSQLKNGLDEEQKNRNRPLGSQMVLIFAFSSSANGGSSTNGPSGSSGSSGSNGGSGIAAYLDHAYTNNIDLNNQMNCILDELSDQWIKGPPIEPPKSSFFLVA
ncbi:proline-rich domain-containing protein [Parageobacillus thermoglucosidasius]|uniref:proline-rich domain-containing protein n=2 Tax=Bacillales TaxID=1385 RepID=UPI003D2DE41D